MNYLDILDKCLVKFRMNLTQSKITSLQSKGFVLDDGNALEDLVPAAMMEVIVSKDHAIVDSVPLVDPTNATFVLHDMAL